MVTSRGGAAGAQQLRARPVERVLRQDEVADADSGAVRVDVDRVPDQPHLLLQYEGGLPTTT